MVIEGGYWWVLLLLFTIYEWRSFIHLTYMLTCDCLRSAEQRHELAWGDVIFSQQQQNEQTQRSRTAEFKKCSAGLHVYVWVSHIFFLLQYPLRKAPQDSVTSATHVSWTPAFSVWATLNLLQNTLHLDITFMNLTGVCMWVCLLSLHDWNANAKKFGLLKGNIWLIVTFFVFGIHIFLCKMHRTLKLFDPQTNIYCMANKEAVLQQSEEYKKANFE